MPSIDLSSLTAPELDDLIAGAAKLRQALQPPVPLEPPQTSEATIDPAWRSLAHGANTILQLRHLGLGWVTVILPPTSGQTFCPPSCGMRLQRSPLPQPRRSPHLHPRPARAATRSTSRFARGPTDDPTRSHRGGRLRVVHRDFRDRVCRRQCRGRTVGFLWFAAMIRGNAKAAYVYPLEVHPEFRRQGNARAAFHAMESIAVAMGLSNIGLHVFGHAPGAQRSYSSLGYQVTGINMQKRLSVSGF